MSELFILRPAGATVLLCLSIIFGSSPALAGSDATPEVAIGERLFLETRFSFSESPHADPVMATSRTVTGSLPGPYRGKTMNCRACHLVDEHAKTTGGGMRAYADFARRTPITARGNVSATTTRNTQQLIGITAGAGQGVVFHYDGQFGSMEELVHATLTGRNYGWLPGEYKKAQRHIATVIRSDDGRGELARAFGGSYRKVLAGTASDLPPEYRLPARYRLDVGSASDTQILQAVSSLIAAYVNDISFARNGRGDPNGSPYDAFLVRNHLPTRPARGETPLAYSRRLGRAVAAVTHPRFVSGRQQAFRFHDQPFVFGLAELEGMKVFFRESGDHAGNCIRCHNAPLFSDFGFHNTGTSQVEYDALHGSGAFARLKVPGLVRRQQDPDRFLPPTPAHPKASGRFRSVASKNTTGTDLGLWNVYANPDMPAPQPVLHRFLCRAVHAEPPITSDCSRRSLLPHALGRFKTPILRDLGHSAPYLHNGSLDTLGHVVAHYRDNAALARSGRLRNGSPHLLPIHLDQKDIASVAAFLRALNEDYE